MLNPLKKCMEIVKDNAVSISRIPEAIMKWEEDNSKMMHLIEEINEKVSQILITKSKEDPNEAAVVIKKEEVVFQDNPTPSRCFRRSGRTTISKIRSSSNSSDSSISSSDEENIKPYDEDRLKSYDLILPEWKTNKIKIEELKLAVIEARDGIKLETELNNDACWARRS